MIDELAHEAKMDPLAYRLALTDDGRARRVLEKGRRDVGLGQEACRPAARSASRSPSTASSRPRSARWSPRSPRSRSTEKTGRIRVHNYWAAADAGLAINPTAFAAQVESAIVWGLSCALKERVTMVNGVVQQSNFHQYEMLRMAEVPEIKVEIVTGAAPSRAWWASSACPCTAPAVANAFFALTGKRLTTCRSRPHACRRR